MIATLPGVLYALICEGDFYSRVQNIPFQPQPRKDLQRENRQGILTNGHSQHESPHVVAYSRHPVLKALLSHLLHHSRPNPPTPCVRRALLVQWYAKAKSCYIVFPQILQAKAPSLKLEPWRLPYCQPPASTPLPCPLRLRLHPLPPSLPLCQSLQPPHKARLALRPPSPYK